MKKTLPECAKSAHYRKSNDLTLISPHKKEFQLLYRERDPDHADEPYQNIIFMKSKKCDAKSKRKGQGKAKEQPVEELREMVAQIEKQFKQKQRQSKDITKPSAPKSPNSAKNLFKNKQIKETFHSKASSRWTKYRKQEALAPENVKKYKNMLSPTRAPKAKEETASSKFLRSTQETFRREKTKATARKVKDVDRLLPFSSEPEEYILLENNFVELTHEDVNLLQLKIASNKTMPEAKPSDISKAFPSSKYYSELDEQFPQAKASSHQVSHLQVQHHQEEEEEDEDDVMEGNEEDMRFYEQHVKVMELYMLSKVKFIQRWWRRVLANKKQKQLDPIVFRKCNEEFEESMSFLHSGLQVSEVSPIKMIEQLHADRREDHPLERADPLQLREEAAEQQLQTHLQLLHQLLEDKRISPNTYFEKKALIEAKYQHELQQIQQLEKLMSENTQRAYQITMKTQEDRNKLQNMQKQIDSQVLDQIFGKDFTEATPPTISSSAIPPPYEMMVVNRQKSTGCHYDGAEEKNKPSIYQKHSEEQYSQDFQEEEQDEGANEGALEECNANFSQLLDEYKSRQQVKMEIDRRAAIQMGALSEQIPEEMRDEHIGIDTSLNSIHRFVLSFFKFYIFYYKDQFLNLINTPYGYNIDRRLSLLHGYEPEDGPEEDENGVIYGLETVISDEIIDEFHEKVYDLTASMPPARRANLEFERIHNRALLDCFNEALNHFRPYFVINGPPYPWNHSEKALTFYYIAQENIQEVFEKTQFKVLRWGSTLCGILPNKYSTPCPDAAGLSSEQALENYRINTHPDLMEAREDRLNKNERCQVAETNHEWGIFDEQTTMVHLENSHYIFMKLVQQFVSELCLTQMHPLGLKFDFFQGLSEQQSEDEHA